MADFIAVIRRAVDGLSENTPEMRRKVYERAKSAVVRQLENMKPRPPEAMFQRQLDKLDAAISEVEAEHSDAVPAAGEPVASEPIASEPVVSAPIVSTTAPPVAAIEPARQPALAEPEPPRHQQPEPVAEVPVVEEAVVAAPVAVEERKPVFEPFTAEPIQQQPAADTDIFSASQLPRHADELPVAAPHSAWQAPVEPPVSHPQPQIVVPPAALPDLAATPDNWFEARSTRASEPERIEAASQAETVEVISERAAPQARVTETAPVAKAAEPIPARAEPVAARRDVTERAPVPAAFDTQLPESDLLETPPPMPKVSYDETDVVAGFNDFLKQELNRQVVPPPPAKARKSDDFSWDAPFDDLPEINQPEAFDKALQAKQQEIAVEGEPRRGRSRPAAPANARAELEDLLGVEPTQRRGTPDPGALPPETGRSTSKLEGKTFKMQKKHRKARRGLPLFPIAAAIVGVLLVGGGAYAAWAYRDTLANMVANVMPAGDAKTPKVATAPDVTADTKTAAADSTKTATKEPIKSLEVASLNSDAATQKFTQRLMPDGTEATTDTTKVPIDKALPEGKTVANQTDAAKEVASTTTTDTKTDAATNTGQPQNDAQPIGATQKMFLYEERLGQTSPVAVPGTVVWREKTDTEDGKPNPAIEAALDVPGRKISAMITIKRNTDASLPASHIIEIVFNLPKDFEEGNVDSIQRIAFKQTEQDRGNPLIAVPAKITDDFHMVALNDDADARKVNLELMKTRGWIDIPISYRNGRRALITLEKGATGSAVFDKVMAEWAAQGAETSNN
jgi:hypothetical protein